LYALLHLTGYDLPMDELRRFRQLGSKTPGHPELGCAPGVETTTGPLGQGISNAVGMAIAERVLAAEFNRPGHDVVDHHTYVFLGDGCLMEGVSHESCALAGTLGLGKLVAVYDDNGISIDSDKGSIGQWYTDDVPKRFAGYGWQVIANVDGHDLEAVDKALRKARREKSRPTLICAKTVIEKNKRNRSVNVAYANANGCSYGTSDGRLSSTWKAEEDEVTWSGPHIKAGKPSNTATFTVPEEPGTYVVSADGKTEWKLDRKTAAGGASDKQTDRGSATFTIEVTAPE